MSAVDSSTPRTSRRAGLLKPLDVNILDKENSASAKLTLLLPFTPNADKVYTNCSAWRAFCRCVSYVIAWSAANGLSEDTVCTSFVSPSRLNRQSLHNAVFAVRLVKTKAHNGLA